MKKITIAVFLILPFLMFSQIKIGKVAEKVQSEQSRLGKFKPFDIFKTGFESARNNYSEETKGGIIVTFDKAGVASIYNESPKQMELNIPFKENGEIISLDLLQVDIFGPNFKAITTDGRDITNEMDRGKHYRGIVAGNPQSLVSISVFKNEIVGFITNGEGNYTIGKLKDSNTKHIINKDTNLRTTQEFICGTEDDGVGYTEEELSYDSSRRAPGDPVGVYVESGQSVYNSFGSNLALTTNFLNGVFGQSYALYANEGISMFTSNMFVWVTPDPYSGVTTGAQLTAFQAQTGAFQGDIGHLVEVQNIGGLAAGFSGICNPNTDQSLCFSGFSGNGFSNIPTVSFNVYIITHEMGHLLGSRHTHACVWNGNNTAIDSCSGYTEGSCALPGSPAGGGTIMSYCINDAVGLDFTQGFGPQPGNVIRNTISNAVCLNCTGPVITCPANLTVECGNDTSPANTGMATVEKGCGNVSIVFNDAITTSNCPGNYTIKRTWTATDEVGNQVQCVQTITVTDTTPPDAQAPPADLNVQCASDVPAPVDLTANDNCNGDITVSPSAVIIPGDCDNQFTVIRTWTFTDTCGNSSSVSQTINVNDTTPPVLIIPKDEIAECDKVPTVGLASATDNCDGSVDAVYLGERREDGDCINNYTLIRTWTATDICGNTTTLDQTITVQDTTAPTVTGIINNTFDLGCNIDESTIPDPQSHIDNGDITGKDNCEGDVKIKLDRTEYIENDCKHYVIYYYKAIDVCGNETTTEDMTSVVYFWQEDDIQACAPSYAMYKDSNIYFTEDADLNSNNPGWTNYFDTPGEYTLSLFASVTDSDTFGDKSGEITVNYTGETVTLEFNLYEPYVMSEASIYIGCEKFPTDNKGDFSINPSYYNINTGALDHVRNYTVGPIDVSNTNQFYIITNPMTCLQKCDCSKSADEGGAYIPDNDTVFCKVGDVLSTGNGFDNAAFKAYPVPFENEVFLEYLFNYDTYVTIEVFDLKGALLNRTFDSKYSSGVKATTKLNMKGLSDEMYFVRLTTNKGSGIKKIIAQ